MNKFLMTLLLLLGISFSAGAQGDPMQSPDYGATPEERVATIEKLNLLTDAYTMKNYEQALNYIRELVTAVPKSNARIYTYAINIYKNKVAFANSLEEKGAYADSLVMYYDLRAEHFADRATSPAGRRPALMASKAYDYRQARPDDRRGVRRFFREAVDLNREEGEVKLLVNYFTLLVEDYQMDSLETEDLLSEYERIYGMIEKRPGEEKQGALKDMDRLLVQSGAANCDNLESIYKPRYQENPNDVELMRKIVSAFIRSGCNNDFQMTVAENYYKASPTPETATLLAKTFEDRQDFEKSLYYLREAINAETDVTAKSEYLVRAAASALGAKNPRQAADFAREALSINPNNGMAQYVIAQAYAVGHTACADVFQQQAVFWLVVDKLNEAKRLMAGDDEQIAKINSDIATYRRNFPSYESIFERDYNEGDQYTVNCGWISGRTVIRKR